MIRIEKIGVISLAKIMGITYAVMGVVFGFFMSLAALFGSQIPVEGAPVQGGMMAMFGGAAIFIMPIMYGVMGFMGGCFTAFIFNIATKFVGGLELEMKKVVVTE